MKTNMDSNPTATSEMAPQNTPVARIGNYYLQTFGCQMNEYDSELISWQLEQMNYASCEDPADADVAVFNTCCVRDNADQKVYGRLGSFKQIKKERPNQVLAVAGCLAQKDGEEFLKRFPQIDIVVGTHNLQELPELVVRVQEGLGRFVRVDRVGTHFDLPANPRNSYSGMVTISMGCDQWCTFCIVPYVRGQLRSRPLAQITSEVQRLAASGHREIMLLGQNVNDYGRDFKDGTDFGHVISALNQVPGLDRLRFTSPHPAYFTQSVIDAMAANPVMCQGVHMPVQSGDSEILTRMKRKYTPEEYLDLVARMRAAISGLSLSTDIIVGFPGETEEQFQRTLDLVRTVRFRSAFMFAYSPRPGTPGAIFKDQVEEEVKMDRLYRLIEIQNNISWEENQKLVGQKKQLLVEGPSRKTPHRFTGRTTCNRPIHFDCDRDLTGHLCEVEITQNFTWGCLAQMLQAEEFPGQWSKIPLTEDTKVLPSPSSLLELRVVS